MHAQASNGALNQLPDSGCFCFHDLVCDVHVPYVAGVGVDDLCLYG